MRLVSYNILNGGEGRADPLAEVILAQGGDIVVLVEAENADVLDRIASRLGMDFFHARGPSHAAAILSRWPIAETIDHAALNPEISKSFFEASVINPNREMPWNIGVVHLHAKAKEQDEQIRERELRIILDVFAERRRRSAAHLLAGDFNSNAPYQKIDPARCPPATQKAWDANGGGVPRRVVSKILQAGYLDTLQLAAPQLSETLGSFTTQAPGQRVDYVFAYGIPQQSIRGAWIEQDRLAKYASDHFPVGVEILD